MFQKFSKTRASTFPFNKATKIEIVSFPVRTDNKMNDTLIQNGQYIIGKFTEHKLLNRTETDSLFSILFDYKDAEAKRGNIRVTADCYTPRHAVLFYNNSEIVEVLELCFECGKIRSQFKTDFGDFCGEKLCQLQSFFIEHELKKEMLFNCKDFQ